MKLKSNIVLSFRDKEIIDLGSGDKEIQITREEAENIYNQLFNILGKSNNLHQFPFNREFIIGDRTEINPYRFDCGAIK